MCERVAVEEDPKKLVELTTEIYRLSEEKRRRLQRKLLDATPIPYFYIAVNCVEIGERGYGYACQVSAYLERPVITLEDDAVNAVGKTIAVVWRGGAILTSPRRDISARIRDEITTQVTEFAAEYYRQNS